MQNKGVIKLLALLLALFTVYQLSFTFVTRHYESKAQKYAESPKTVALATEMANGDQNAYEYYLDSIKTARETYYLDSIGTIKVYMWQDYRKCKEQELNLGLDLKGGMNVLMEVSVPDIIYALSGNSNDPIFREAMHIAEEQHLNSQKDFVALFGEAFAKLDPNARLAPIFLYELKDKSITVNSTNDEVLKVIKEETDSAIDRSYKILRTRIDRFGVAQPNIQKLESSGRILVELPGIKDPKRVRKLLQGTAQLEFWETYNFSEIYQYFDEANAMIAKAENANKPATAETEEATENSDVALLEQMTAEDSLKKAQEKAREEYMENNPLYTILIPSYYQGSNGMMTPGETARVGMPG